MVETKNARPAANGTGDKQADETFTQSTGRGDFPAAGEVLAAVDELRSQQSFTRDQVARLMQLAFDSGRYAGYKEDLAELREVWASRAEQRESYEQRVTGRIADMERCAAHLAVRMHEANGRLPWKYEGGPVDWETGRPLRESASQASQDSGPSHFNRMGMAA